MGEKKIWGYGDGFVWERFYRHLLKRLGDKDAKIGVVSNSVLHFGNPQCYCHTIGMLHVR